MISNARLYQLIALLVFVLEFFLLRAATTDELWRAFLVSSFQILFSAGMLAYLLRDSSDSRS
jgi:hypothetical protein